MSSGHTMSGTTASTRRAGAVGALVAAGYAVFQVALAAGAPWGRSAWGGAHRVLPTGFRVASATTAPVYAALAVALAAASSTPPSRRRRRVLRIAAAVLALGVPLNLASRSPAERPHALGAAAMAVGCFLVTRTPKGEAARPATVA